MEGTLSAVRWSYAAGGYAWTVTGPDGTLTQYATDKESRGLWRDGTQIMGTADFELGCSPSWRREKVRRLMDDPTTGTLPMVDKIWETYRPTGVPMG